jgi:predicted nucleic acid-binding protein
VNLVDSSAWLEYFADGPNAAYFAPAIEKTLELLVPAVVLFEVFKRVLQQRSEKEALAAVSVMQQGEVVDFTGALALKAARLSQVHKLPMADSIILATARAHGAVIWTQDADFDGMEKVNFRPHKAGPTRARR